MGIKVGEKTLLIASEREMAVKMAEKHRNDKGGRQFS